MSSPVTVAPATARSSLEEMLESLKRRDEKPKDMPPALPVRPTLKGRLPSSKRSLPLNFKIESSSPEYLLKDSEKRDKEERASKGEKDIVYENGALSRKRTVKVDQLEESPNVKMPELECYEERAGDIDVSDYPVAPSSTAGQRGDRLGLDDTTDHVLKKDSIKEHPQVQASALVDLQRRVENAEAALRQKEEENGTLQQQLQQYETRWSDYEAKMKSKEEMWRKEVTSLQMKLDAVEKCLADASPIRHDHDSENVISADAHAPQSTPPRQTCASCAGLARNSDGTRNEVGHLVKEFEQRTQVFEDDIRSLVKAKSGSDPVEEVRKLKVRLATWKKDYKARLRKVKASVETIGNSEGEKARRKWWGKKCRS